MTHEHDEPAEPAERSEPGRRGLSRRRFLSLAGGAAALGAAGVAAACSSSPERRATTTAPGGERRLPRPQDAPFDTVVVLMMENRSFDHLLGWVPGANGKQAGLRYVDQTGASHETWRLAPDWQGCQYQDPFHTWQAMATHYDGGTCDGFLLTQPTGDLFPIGYYGEGDLPILEKLATSYTLFDDYFASMLGPTWPNRLYQLCATTDLDYTGFFPEPGQPRPVGLETAIFDRVQAAGKTAAYYYFGEPMTGLFASERYDSISYRIERFFEDAEKGKLANVTFVDPDYTAHAEFNGTSNDYHPYGSVLAAEKFVADVHDAIARSPQWDRTVLVINFDEAGGFFDHVPPPAVEDDTVLPGEGPFPDLKRLGFRVPAIVAGPFAPKQIYADGPFEHCSVLKLIEWRWGIEPMTVRDRTARNLAEALDFEARRDPVELPAFDPPPAEVCPDPTGHLP